MLGFVAYNVRGNTLSSGYQQSKYVTPSIWLDGLDFIRDRTSNSNGDFFDVGLP